MFFDQNRNTAYFNALQAVITPDSLVLDLGAGMGIHGLLAARLGAKKVYMIEPESVLNVARQFAQGNGFSDRVEYIQSKIENITLPEQVEVIVSVFTGNFYCRQVCCPLDAIISTAANDYPPSCSPPPQPSVACYRCGYGLILYSRQWQLPLSSDMHLRLC